MLFLIIGAVCVAVILGIYATFVLQKRSRKQVAQPVQAIPAEALAHVQADAGTVSVTSVRMEENPTNDTESEPSSFDEAPIESEPTSNGTKIPIVFEAGSDQPLAGAPSSARGVEDGVSAETPVGADTADGDAESNDDTSRAPRARARQSLAL